MNKLADALVYAVTYISLWQDEREEFLDDDVGALEGIAADLHLASEAEKDALAAAAERALAAEHTLPQPRPQFLREYGHWMEEMFGEPWQGNKRVG